DPSAMKVSVVKCKTSAADMFVFSSRRRHTSSLRDWSSDVGSSDLPSILSPSTATWAALPTSVWMRMYALTAIEPPCWGGAIVAMRRSSQDKKDEQETRRPAVKQVAVDAHDRLLQRVGQEQDDILATIQLVHGDD